MAFPAELFENAVQYERRDGIAIIRMSQPEKMNVMTGPLVSGVQHALDIAAEDPTVRVVVFTGTGRAFCAGGNLAGGTAAKVKTDAPEQKLVPTVSRGVRMLRFGMASSECLRNMDKPTIAAVNGACAGAGFAWACACDLRFAAESAVFKTAFATAGLSGDYGGTWTLPRIVGSAKARELYFLNKKVLAKEAQRIGLVSDVFPDNEFMERVLEEAKTMAAFPPLALKRIKQNLNDADRMTSFVEALSSEAERHQRAAYHPDAAEAGKAFMEKRPPNFAGVGKRAPWEMSKL